MLNIGKDIKSGDYVYLDSSRSRAVLVCGKRGSGKSYTLGVIIEELLEDEKTLVVIIDPMGIYYPMANPNREQERLLWEWGLTREKLACHGIDAWRSRCNVWWSRCGRCNGGSGGSVPTVSY